jgi:hypothetical protein
VACVGVQNRLFLEAPAMGAKGNAHISTCMGPNGVTQSMVDSCECGLPFGVIGTCSRAAVPPQYRCIGCNTHVHI